MKVLVTGSAGLIGSEAAEYYLRGDHEVIGVDNNMRKRFFGDKGDTSPVRSYLQGQYANYRHLDLDVREREEILRVFKEEKPDYVVHTAAQPSHDWAAREPFTDFDVNAIGTLNLLEGFRQFSPEGVFCLLSTNKVYGDAPNRLPLEELETRWEYKGELRGKGISESLSVDQCLHSLFGASKLSADIVAQEYGKYFGLNIGIFRGGCLTGSRHAGVPLHGFLSYLVHCAVSGTPYQIIGYQGKQVRDQIHSEDVIRVLDTFRRNPRPGEVYNLGGGFENSVSVLEAIRLLREEHGLELKTSRQETPRIGDHICYYTDFSKFKSHYPEFRLKWNLRDIVGSMVEAEQGKHSHAA